MALGADVVSATAPSYFNVTSPDGLVDCMAKIAAAAPQLPFYYYHIPSLTAAAVEMVDFLRIADFRIPNLAGLKYTCPDRPGIPGLARSRGRAIRCLLGMRRNAPFRMGGRRHGRRRQHLQYRLTT